MLTCVAVCAAGRADFVVPTGIMMIIRSAWWCWHPSRFWHRSCFLSGVLPLVRHLQAELCNKRLGRAGKLTNLLGDELVRWVGGVCGG